MAYMLDVASGPNGGARQVARDPGRARNIHVTIQNPTATTHGVFFGRSRRELVVPPPQGGISGFCVPAVPNTVANQTINTIAYTNFLLQGWVGELWAAADYGPGAVAPLQVEVYDSAVIEK